MGGTVQSARLLVRSGVQPGVEMMLVVGGKKSVSVVAAEVCMGLLCIKGITRRRELPRAAVLGEALLVTMRSTVTPGVRVGVLVTVLVAVGLCVLVGVVVIVGVSVPVCVKVPVLVAVPVVVAVGVLLPTVTEVH